MGYPAQPIRKAEFPHGAGLALSSGRTFVREEGSLYLTEHANNDHGRMNIIPTAIQR